MRKILVLAVVIILASAALAAAGWQVAHWVKGDSGAPVARKAATSGVEKKPAANKQAAASGETAAKGGEGAEAGVERSGESSQVKTPGMRYVTETQRHQNFFKALAEGQVKRLEVTATDFMPDLDRNTSYVYAIITTADGGRSDGRIVMKYSSGLWRIGAVNLSGILSGGTNVAAPECFEADLARELKELQDFMKKTAEGRLAYMTVDAVNPVGDCEVVLTGVVASKGGKVYPSEMRLRKDYGLWHVTNILCL